MRSHKEKLGKYIKRIERRNTDQKYGIEDVRGISNTKEVQDTKADVSDRSFDRFQIVNPNEFVFNRRTTRMGEKIGLGFNSTNTPFIVTEDYVVFCVIDPKELLPDFLNVFFRRDEFDRYARWDSWGSATEFFNWEEMCEVPIQVPDIDIQQRFVSVYKAICRNVETFESGLANLRSTCNAYIEKLAYQMPKTPIGSYIEPVDDRNIHDEYDLNSVRGISISKAFIPTKANMEGVSLTPYILVKPESFAFVSVTSRNGEKISIAYNNSEETIIVSSSYVAFRIANNGLLPHYLFMLLSRPDFDRYARYNSWGSARETLEWGDFCRFSIPIPRVEIQQDIVDIFSEYENRKRILEQLKALQRDICPILIKGAWEEAQKA